MSTIYVVVGSASSVEYARIERALDILASASDSFRSCKVVVRDDSWANVFNSVVEGLGFQTQVEVMDSARCGAFAFSRSGKFLGRADAFLEGMRSKFGLTLDGSEEYFAGLAEENGERFNAAEVGGATIFAAGARDGGSMDNAVDFLLTVLGDDVEVALKEG